VEVATINNKRSACIPVAAQQQQLLDIPSRPYPIAIALATSIEGGGGKEI